MLVNVAPDAVDHAGLVDEGDDVHHPQNFAQYRAAVVRWWSGTSGVARNSRLWNTCRPLPRVTGLEAVFENDALAHQALTLNAPIEVKEFPASHPQKISHTAP